MHLFFTKVTSEEMNLLIVKGLLDVKHVDIVASLKQVLHQVATKKTTPTNHGTGFALKEKI